MKRAFAVLGVLLLLVLLASMAWLRRRAVVEASDRTARLTAGAEGIAEPEPPQEPAHATPAPPPADASKQPLRGLRRMPDEVATARGWRRPERPEDTNHLVRATRAKWARTNVSFSFQDEPLESVVKAFEKAVGMPIRIDRDVSFQDRTVTFRVMGLSAHETLDLVLKMSDLRFAIDAAGAAWITSPDRAATLAAPPDAADDPVTLSARRIRSESGRTDGAESRQGDAWWKGQRVSVTIVNKSLREAIDMLGAALGQAEMPVAFWSSGAEDAADKALLVTVVAQDEPVEKVLEQILQGSGIRFVMDEGSPALESEEEAADLIREEEELRKQVAAEARESDSLRPRRAKIEGTMLKASDVANQLAAQLGIKLRMSSEVEFCPVVWESDGLEQTAGEILDILARDGELIWRWQGEYEPTARFPIGPRLLWIVGAKEK